MTNRERLIECMSRNLDDLYVIGRPPEAPEYEFDPYLANPLVIVAPSNHPLVGVSGIPLNLIAEQPFVMRERGSGTRMAAQNDFDRHGLRLNVRTKLGSSEAINQATLGGLEIATLSKHALGVGGAQSGLTILDVEGFPIPWQ